MKKVLMGEGLDYNGTLKIGNHQYAKLLSKNDYEVLWLSPIYNNIYKYFKNEKYDLSSLNKINEIYTNLYEYKPKSLLMYGNNPIFRAKLFNKLTIDFTYPNIKKVLNKNGFIDVDILWINNMKYYYLKDIVKYNKLFYRCSDDISGFKGVCKSMLYFEQRLIKEADKVFITSKDLIEKKSTLRDDLVYLPNGVELNNFQREKYIMPDEFRNVNNKKCIFVGALHDWIDVDLIKYCCKKLNAIEFYFIGPVDTDLSLLNGINNIHLLGKRKYDDIPNYLYYSDASIIPFKVNNLTNSITPVKLYEYMSVGLNVVTTNFKEMNYIKSPAYIAKSYDEFCDYLLQAIENKDINKEKNIQFSKENTWDKRFEVIKKYL